MRHDSDDSSVPANLEPLELSLRALMVILCVFMVFDVFEIPNKFIIIIIIIIITLRGPKQEFPGLIFGQVYRVTILSYTASAAGS